MRLLKGGKNMKINFDKKKNAEVVSEMFQKTSDLSKKVAAGVQNGARDIVDRTKNESYIWRMKKYNPLFPEQYQSKEFNIPNMIMIVDDAVRRGVDVCEGAIGWIKQENGVEILYLYDEAIEMSGIQFIPDAQCDAIYYVDRFDRNRFVKVECLFSKAQEEKIAELEHIAYSLGAKSCSVEISESNIEEKVKKGRFDFSGNTKSEKVQVSRIESAEQGASCKISTKNSGRGIVYFQGNNTPKRPELKWFKHDENIKRLIEMRCRGENEIKSKVLELQGASSAVMSAKTACTIETVMEKLAGKKGNVELERQAIRECHSKFIFNIEF